MGNKIRLIAIIGVIVVIFGLLFSSFAAQQNPSNKVWNTEATVGSAEANKFYVMYTDLLCPYCDVFSREVMWNWDEFTAFLEDHKILFEIRLTDYLYEGSDVQYSRDAAEAAYCAMHEDKFWDFYHEALQSLWDDYHSKGIGDSKTSPSIKDMPSDYFLKIGHEVGLGESFDNCVKNHDTVAEIENNTRRALQVANGMPTFQFNKYTNYGFDSSWGWDYVKMYLEAGL